MALDLASAPEVAAAAHEGSLDLLEHARHVSSDSRLRLAASTEEISLNALMSLPAGALGEPGLRVIERPEHELDGRMVPGNRGLDDNPDTLYRVVPLDRSSHFLLEGRLAAAPAAVMEFSLLSREWKTLANLSRRDLATDPEGRFRVETGPEPRTDDSHFLQVSESPEMLLVRETFADWARESPAGLHVRDLRDAGHGGADTGDELAAEAAERVRKWFSQTVALHAGPWRRPANTLPVPEISNSQGMLTTQAYSVGRFHLEGGDSLIVTVDPGDAAYAVVPVTNIWGISGDPVNRQVSLNTSQACGNKDGTFCFVVCRQDPGAYNWVDTEGLDQGFLFVRWAEFSAGGGSGRQPSVSTHVVPAERLAETLPRETHWIDPAEREHMLRRRAEQYHRRFRWSTA